MAKYFSNVQLVLLTGIVLAVILMGTLDADLGSVSTVMRWLHLFFGVLWIGLLYYFNFVQIPTMPTIADELKPAVSKHIAPNALFYFRWSALATVVTGAAVASHPSSGAQSYLVEALTFQEPYLLIGVGMWIALIMAANVWFVIWPNQKKALGIITVEPAAKATAAKLAMMASRTNLLLSLPMLYAMVNANHG